MLFVVESCAEAEMINSARTAAVTLAVARLLSNYADGHHLLLMRPELCRAIEADDVYSMAEKATAKRIRNRYSDFGALATKLPMYAKVVASGVNPSRVGQNWQIPLAWLSQYVLRETHVHGEDLNDIDVVEAAAEDFLARAGLLAFKVAAAPVPGGGGNTHRIFSRNALLDQKISVCVVDSDKQCPSDGYGATAAPCVGTCGVGVFEVAVTEGRTLENSLPWRVIDAVRNTATPPSTELSNFDSLAQQSSGFLNFKRGIAGFDFKKLAGPRRQFWENATSQLFGASPCCAGDCQATDWGNCQYKPWGGFGGGLLSDVGRWLKENRSPARSTAYLPSPNDAHWQRLGEILGSYCIAAPVRRI